MYFDDDDDVFECTWCEAIQHRTCIQMSSQQFSVLSDVASTKILYRSFVHRVCMNSLVH